MGAGILTDKGKRLIARAQPHNRYLSHEEMAEMSRVAGGDLINGWVGGVPTHYKFGAVLEDKEKTMSIYRVYFVNREDNDLHWSHVIAESKETAVVKAFLKLQLEDIDDYIIKTNHCYDL